MERWRGRWQFGNLVTEDLAVRKAERARSRRPEVAEGKFSPQRHRGQKGRKKVFAKGIGDAVTAGRGVLAWPFDGLSGLRAKQRALGRFRKFS